MPGFGPAAEVLLVRQKDPKPLTLRPASSDKANAGHGRAGQLAVLKQGPPVVIRGSPLVTGGRRQTLGEKEGYEGFAERQSH